MKYMKILGLLLTITLFSNMVYAQDDDNSSDNNPKKKGHSLTIDQNGLNIHKDKRKNAKDEDRFEMGSMIFDLGLNSLVDKTNYNSTATQNFLKVDPSLKNSNLFDMNQGKSVNVNIYPLTTKYRVLATDNQKIYLVSGIGLQLYNFRFNKPITYTNTTSPAIVYEDSAQFSKNKLAFDYVNIPLGLTCKTRLSGKRWLVYGAGLTGGYRLASWTKQISSEMGKQKDHDQFDFSNFNSCVTGELGIDNVFRLYATYQLTSLQMDGLNQHPFCIGIRFSGI